MEMTNTIDLSKETIKLTGSHYTPKSLSDFVADQILKHWVINKKTINILDPSVGDGELLLALIDKLKSAKVSNIIANGFDINNQAVVSAGNRIKETFPNIKTDIQLKDFIDVALEHNDVSLFATNKLQYDLVIANPPYVRTQHLGSNKSQLLSKQFNLTGRVDLYFAFLFGIYNVIQEGGIVGIIVSNRFMTTKSGSSVREGLKKYFDILHVYDLGDTKLFEAAVLPAVLILRKKTGVKSDSPTLFTSVYTSKEQSKAKVIDNFFEVIEKEGIYTVANKDTFEVRQGVLEFPKNESDIWRVSNTVSDGWLNTVNSNCWKTIKEVLKVRVGVKTTADKIFIRDDWETFAKNDIPEHLEPILTHDIAARYKADTTGYKKRILYPYKSINGKRQVVALKDSPKMNKYLLLHYDVLNKRTYVIESGRQWYEIWVPQDPKLWVKSKIVFPDISEYPTFWMDKSKSIVSGECYWMVLEESNDEDLLWLILAVCNSKFIEDFYDHKFHNKLYSGRRRFITQYVQEFPIPNPELKQSKKIVSLVKSVYDNIPSKDTAELESEINRLVFDSFGLSPKE